MRKGNDKPFVTPKNQQYISPVNYYESGQLYKRNKLCALYVYTVKTKKVRLNSFCLLNASPNSICILLLVLIFFFFLVFLALMLMLKSGTQVPGTNEAMVFQLYKVKCVCFLMYNLHLHIFSEKSVIRSICVVLFFLKYLISNFS